MPLTRRACQQRDRPRPAPHPRARPASRPRITLRLVDFRLLFHDDPVHGSLRVFFTLLIQINDVFFIAYAGDFGSRCVHSFLLLGHFLVHGRNGAI